MYPKSIKTSTISLNSVLTVLGIYGVMLYVILPLASLGLVHSRMVRVYLAGVSGHIGGILQQTRASKIQY